MFDISSILSISSILIPIALAIFGVHILPVIFKYIKGSAGTEYSQESIQERRLDLEFRLKEAKTRLAEIEVIKAEKALSSEDLEECDCDIEDESYTQYEVDDLESEISILEAEENDRDFYC